LAEAIKQQDVGNSIEDRNMSRYPEEQSRIGDGASILIAFAIAYSYRKMRKKRRILIQKSKKNVVTPPPGTIL